MLTISTLSTLTLMLIMKVILQHSFLFLRHRSETKRSENLIITIKRSEKCIIIMCNCKINGNCCKYFVWIILTLNIVMYF